MPVGLWSFALALYARPGVEEACLRLQAQGADVCLLLAGAWLDGRGIACEERRLHVLRAIAAPWRHLTIQPLRDLRESWRTPAREDAALNALREAIKALELQAERELLARLERAAEGWSAGESSPASAWLETLADAAGERDRDALERLRAAALAP
ncbi:TIGR02444 family protein [Pseudomonas sp. RIT-PI-AD]|uniref:TIGR02444 family protein n=1 Tax=Pseudomonas sp. RIT-PI-AD TaxID=3035294 RepID=UPI0021D8B0C9|nr:TIGR02444 family protein [Pseudomonas sp. RIT-PI-AD]